MSALDRLKLLGDGADRLTRQRAEAEAEERRGAEERRARERAQRREAAAAVESDQVTALRHEIADLRHELANMQAHLVARDKDFLGIIDNLVGGLDKAPAFLERMIEARVKLSEGEMAGKIAERFGELMGRIEALGPHPARAAKGESFKFASERSDDGGDVIDLPNPLRYRTVIN